MSSAEEGLGVYYGFTTTVSYERSKRETETYLSDSIRDCECEILLAVGIRGRSVKLWPNEKIR